MKVAARCQTCADSTKPGRLWLGGVDWLECPDCAGTTVVEFDESRYTPRERKVFIPGIAPHTERKLFIPRIKGIESGFDLT